MSQKAYCWVAPSFARIPLNWATYTAPAPKGITHTVDMATTPMENIIFEGLTSISLHTPRAKGKTMLNTAIALGTICAIRHVTIT